MRGRGSARVMGRPTGDFDRHHDNILRNSLRRKMQHADATSDKKQDGQRRARGTRKGEDAVSAAEQAVRTGVMGIDVPAGTGGQC